MSCDSLQKLDLNDAGDIEEEQEDNDPSSPDTEKERSVELNAIHNAKYAVILKLPREVLAYILKWVIGDHLDVVSLGRWALVCKDFLCLTQDASLWHAMCQKVWGFGVKRKPYPTWQTHFVLRPHVHIHGVYISKTSYIRTGDASISYTHKPYYYVEYFRILRFFANGEVIMLTTPQDPREVVHKLETKNKKVQGLLLGTYVVQEDKHHESAVITATLEKYYTPKDGTFVQTSRNRRGNWNASPVVINTYRVELKLTSTSSKRKFNKLMWLHHSCCTRYPELGRENTCTYNVSNQYPALFFNRIKAFSAESLKPL